MADHESVTAATRQWVEETVGRPVVGSRRLVGGRSSDVHRCWLDDDSSVVVRHISNRRWLEREPYLIDNEADALAVLERSVIQAPSVLGADSRSGRLVMSFEPGEMLMTAPALRPRVTALAELAAKIRLVELPVDSALRRWRSWVPAAPTPPSWGDRGLWADAIAVHASSPPATVSGATLLHRDLHPGNVLWNGMEVSAIVDWVNACIGHPHAELGHCRWNLTCLVDRAAAQVFLDHYLAVTGDDGYDPWWDLNCALSFLPGPIDPTGWNDAGRLDLTTAAIVSATEKFIRSALEKS